MLVQTKDISEIDLRSILPNSFELRFLDETYLSELTNSIKANGLLQPILVKPLGQEQYRLVFGLHRLEAVRRLGWERIPAIIRTVSDDEAFLISVTENLQRNIYINPIAEAKGYKCLISKNWTIREIAARVGKSDSYICNRLRVLDRLHPEIQRQIEFPRGNSCLSLSHAEHLSSIDDPQHQLELARLVEERRLSMRQLEILTKRKGGKTMPEGCLCSKCPSFKCKLYANSRR